jgi:hypothetical protein
VREERERSERELAQIQRSAETEGLRQLRLERHESERRERDLLNDKKDQAAMQGAVD